MNVPDHPIIERLEKDGGLYENEKPILYCYDCHEGIYEGDAYYKIGFEKAVYCPLCIENYREKA